MSKQKMSQSWYKKWWVITLFIFFALIIIGSLVDNGNSVNQLSTPTPQQQEDKTKVKNEPITLANEELKKSVTIPGISAVDVYGNLKNIGFSCSGPKIGSDRLVFWECKEETSEHMYLVEILGESPSKILTVQVTALNYSSKNTDSIVKDFFSYVASVPYDNADQISARNWVIQNIAQKTNKVINNVRFTIAGNERSRILTIANENSDLD